MGKRRQTGGKATRAKSAQKGNRKGRLAPAARGKEPEGVSAPVEAVEAGVAAEKAVGGGKVAAGKGLEGGKGSTRAAWLPAAREALSKFSGPSGIVLGGPTKESAGVLYVGHIPHGFYEDQMLGFFSQFGTVNRVRVSRSPKTARSRGYGFVEFEDREVARIVAETMHGYFLEKKVLQVKLLDPAQVHPRMFAGAHRKFKKIPWVSVARRRAAARAAALSSSSSSSATSSSASTTPSSSPHLVSEAVSKLTAAMEAADEKRRAKLAAVGIDFDFSAAETGAAKRRMRKRGRPEEEARGAGEREAAEEELEDGAAKKKGPTPKKRKKTAKTPAKSTPPPTTPSPPPKPSPPLTRRRAKMRK